MSDRPSFTGCSDYRTIWREWGDDEEDQREDDLSYLRSIDPAEDVQYLRNLPYYRYLKSTHWDIKRRIALLRAGHQCQRCGTAKGRRLDVHHRTYERLGCEADSDLIVLCSMCHAVEHGGDDFLVVAKVLGEASAAYIANDSLAALAMAAASIRNRSRRAPNR